MDPWSTSNAFVEELGAVMRNAILCSIGTVRQRARLDDNWDTTGNCALVCGFSHRRELLTIKRKLKEKLASPYLTACTHEGD